MSIYEDLKVRFKTLVPADCHIGEEFYLLHVVGRIKYMVKSFYSEYGVTLLVRNGFIKITIDMTMYTINASSLFVIIPGQIFQINDMSEDVDFTILLMSEIFTNNLFSEQLGSLSLQDMITYNPLTRLDATTLQAFDKYLQALKDVFTSSITKYQIETAKHLTLAMFYGIVFTLHVFDKKEIPISRSATIFQQFNELLKQYATQEHEVNFYADKLCITPKHLAVVVQEQAGKSAIRCINEYLLNACEALLLSTSMNLQEITYKLNFPSPSVFSKFFKRMTGVSPREYRKQTD